MLDCGFSPLMSSLSDRNMRLGDVLLPPGIKQRCLYPRVQGLFTLRKVLLMQLSVALSLHFGWDSQLNTNEVFWIGISTTTSHKCSSRDNRTQCTTHPCLTSKTSGSNPGM